MTGERPLPQTAGVVSEKGCNMDENKENNCKISCLYRGVL